MRKEKSISTDDWIDKYQEEFIQKIKEEEINLDLFHFTLDKLNILRIRILMNCGLSSFNKSHTKIIEKINKEFEDYIRGDLEGLLGIKSNKNKPSPLTGEKDGM